MKIQAFLTAAVAVSFMSCTSTPQQEPAPGSEGRLEAMGFRELESPFERWYLPEQNVPGDFEQAHTAYSPMMSYKHAIELFENGDKSEGAYWMYMGQLRSRILIDCKNLIPWNSFNDSFVAAQSDVGRVINSWLGTEPDIWIETLDQVAGDYKAKEDPEVEAGVCDAAVEKNLQGLAGLREMVVAEYK